MDIGAYPKPKNQVKILQNRKNDSIYQWDVENQKTDSINDDRKMPQIMLKKPGSIYTENQETKTRVSPLNSSIVTSDSRLKLTNPEKNEKIESDFVS